MIYYAGIGSRKTPDDIIRKFKVFGASFAELGFTLRSGAAVGADVAFEDGCDAADGRKEIYLPWENYKKHESNLFGITPEAEELAGEIYGHRWKGMRQSSRLYLTRDMYQVTGYDLDTPSSFIVCWTPDGCLTKADRTKDTGGTGQAIAYASELDIPVFNIKNPFDEAHLFNYVHKLLGEDS